jgi:hypothetical protein
MTDPTKELAFQNDVIAQMVAGKKAFKCHVTFFLPSNILIVTAQFKMLLIWP